MIKMDGETFVLECDCHKGGHEVTMAKVSAGRLTIISKTHGSTHFVDIGLDRLGKMCNAFVEVGEKSITSKS